MKIGIKQWNKKAPRIIKVIAGIALAVSMTITGTSVWNENIRVQKIGAIAMGISLILPKLVGETTKEEQNNEQPID